VARTKESQIKSNLIQVLEDLQTLFQRRKKPVKTVGGGAPRKNYGIIKKINSSMSEKSRGKDQWKKTFLLKKKEPTWGRAIRGGTYGQWEGGEVLP